MDGGKKWPRKVFMDNELKSRQMLALARQEKLALDERRREKHLPVACALRNPRQAAAIIAEASEQIRLWRSRQLCSADYIRAWEWLLKQPVEAANVLESRSLRSVQLRQDSPFVAAVRRWKTTSF